jgi:hypothetical protein
MEWLINQSGTIRASFFYRENTDYLTTATNTGGAGRARRIGGGLTYRRDFDKIGDIFKKRNNRTKPKPPVQQPDPDPKKEGTVPKQE